MTSQYDHMTRDRCEASLGVSGGGKAMTARSGTNTQVFKDTLCTMRRVRSEIRGSSGTTFSADLVPMAIIPGDGIIIKTLTS